jgi:hypothetical protein
LTRGAPSFGGVPLFINNLSKFKGMKHSRFDCLLSRIKAMESAGCSSAAEENTEGKNGLTLR